MKTWVIQNFLIFVGQIYFKTILELMWQLFDFTDISGVIPHNHTSQCKILKQQDK